jgi:hypothetical protein
MDAVARRIIEIKQPLIKYFEEQENKNANKDKVAGQNEIGEQTVGQQENVTNEQVSEQENVNDENEEQQNNMSYMTFTSTPSKKQTTPLKDHFPFDLVRSPFTALDETLGEPFSPMQEASPLLDRTGMFDNEVRNIHFETVAACHNARRCSPSHNPTQNVFPATGLFIETETIPYNNDRCQYPPSRPLPASTAAPAPLTGAGGLFVDTALVACYQATTGAAAYGFPAPPAGGGLFVNTAFSAYHHNHERYPPFKPLPFLSTQPG